MMARVAGVLVVVGLMAGAVGVGAAAQWFDQPEVDYENSPYNGKFRFARIRFVPSEWGGGPHAWGLDLKWNHDYPRADRRLEEIIELVTSVVPNTDGGNIIAIDDPELFRYPWAYLCEVGFLTLTSDEAEAFRNYLLKGGFVVVDDFDEIHWYNFVDQMEKVIPGGEFIEIDETHPIFHSFFDIRDIHFGAGRGFRGGFRGYGWPRYYALYEDNDPSKRMMMIANFNNDIGEYWEFADSGDIEISLTNEAFKLGVNYVMYSMTH